MELPKLEKIPKQITKYYVKIDDTLFELNDLYETVEAVGSSDIHITNKNMVEMLKKYEVIESEGNPRWMMGATKGKNYEAFFNALDDLYESK